MTKYLLFALTLLSTLNFSFGQDFWKPLNGPDGNKIIQIGVDTSGNYYLVTEGKHIIFRSIDNCQTWEPFDQGIPEYFFQYFSKFVSGRDGSLYLKTMYSIYVLRPNEETWIELKIGENNYSDISVNPNGDVYIVEHSNIYKSTDNGTTFQTMSIVPYSASLISVNGGGRNYVIGRDLKLNVFDDEGNVSKKNNLPLFELKGMFYDPEIHRLFIYKLGNCFYTDDEGLTWNALNFEDTGLINFMALSPENTLYCNAGKKTFKSNDHGDSWGVFNNDENCIPKEVESMVFYDEENILILPYHYVYDQPYLELSLTNDGFKNCQKIITGITQPFIKKISKDNNGVFYAKVDPNRFLISFNDWQSWKDLKLPFENEIISWSHHDMDGNIYVTTIDYKVYRSFDHGESWTEITPKNTEHKKFESIYTNPAGKIYLTAAYSCYTSIDKGESWAFHSNFVYQELLWTEWFFHPDGTIYAYSSSGLFYSKDDGITWTSFFNNHNPEISAFKIANNGDLLLILGTSRYLHRYRDGKDKTIKSEVYGTVDSNTDGDIFIFDRGKIKRTSDEGANWEDITYNFGNNNYPGIMFVDNDQFLYAGAYYDLLHKSNFSTIQNHVITGEVFLDANNNCVKDESEHGLEGWKVELSGTIQRELTTNNTGNYATKISDGHYRLKLVLPDEGVWFTCENEIFLNFDSPQKDTTVVVFTVQDKTTGSFIETGPALPIVEIHPNPFTERTRIMIKNVQLPENSILRVYDHLGKLIRTESVFSNEFEFHRNGLPAGLYFFDISGGNKIIARGKLMMQ